jgi:hypothetical protein
LASSKVMGPGAGTACTSNSSPLLILYAFFLFLRVEMRFLDITTDDFWMLQYGDSCVTEREF